jgi:2-polyprenyl-3-methyl-5-hydroxy-6-metoxy-1,4-benzoquinol methylase
VRNVPIEQFAKRMGRYDLIFSLAVLEHVHYDSDWIFKKLASRCDWLLTIEDEEAWTAYHFPRAYGQIFAELGMTETYTDNDLLAIGLGSTFRARLFKGATHG